MQALEEKMCRGINIPIRDESEDEDNVEENAEAEAILDLEEERLFRAISKFGKRPKFEVPTLSKNLNPEEVIDWINELEEYFEYEDIMDPDRVKFVRQNERDMQRSGGRRFSWSKIERERTKSPDGIG